MPPSTGFNSNSRILLYAELINLLLSVQSVTKNCIQDILKILIEYIHEDNVYNRFNLNFMKTSGLMNSLLSCLVNMSKEGHDVPVDLVSQILSYVPTNKEFIENLVKCCLLLCPPHFLYLPFPDSQGPSSNNINPTEMKYFEKIHSGEVVDITSILGNSLHLSLSAPDLSNQVNNLEYLETEENAVLEWEVIPNVDSILPTPEPPQPPTRQESEFSSTPLLSALLHAAVTKLRLLSDVNNQNLFSPHLLLPLVCHSSPEVHSGALQILRFMLERRTNQKNSSQNYEELFELISKLISGHNPSPMLVESVLSLVHGHHINIDIAYEFSMTTYSCMNMQKVTILLPPVLLMSYTEISLCHNLITHIHELAANIPAFLTKLLQVGLYDSLFLMLIKIGASPGVSSDMCGFYESDLLVEDINNLLRLIIVKYINQTQANFETILDMLFSAASLVSSKSFEITGYLRTALSLCMEEGLFCLQNQTSDYKLYKPSNFLNIEDCTNLQYSNRHSAGQRNKKSEWVGCNLADRFSKLLKFSVNYLCSLKPEQPMVEEEIGLTTSIYNLLLDLELEMSSKKENDPLVKCLKDTSSFAGVVLLLLLKSDISMSNKISLIRKIDALPNKIDVVQKLYVSPEERETFRLIVISLVSQTLLMDSVDCDMVTRFYGTILSVSIFPSGPGSSQPLEYVEHKSFQPWMAERDRCSKKVKDKEAKKNKYLHEVTDRYTNSVVGSHDSFMKDSLESIRKGMCQSYDSFMAWKNIVSNQSHPLGLWHDESTQPKSSVLENICGHSGIYTRFKPGHVGLHKSKYFKPDHEDLISPLITPFPKLLNGDQIQNISLSDRLGGVETVQTVMPVCQVTATDQLRGEMLVSGDKIFFMSQVSWSCSFTKIEAACKRRFQLKDIAIEFFLSSGETHLIVFNCVTDRNSLYGIINGAGVPGQLKSSNLTLTTKLWRQGHLTNFQYLFELNRLAGRTFSDLMQHPVFPWILADYDSPHLNLTLPQTFRCLRKPIAVQKSGSEEKYLTNYKILSSDGSGLGGVMGPYHYASHYSNTGIVLHFLVRVPPYTGEFIKFQDGNFDLPDRSFHKLGTSWLMASEVSVSDVKELIPQLFYLPEMFINQESFNFGKRQNGDQVDNVELPAWAGGDPRTFVKIHRQALESAYIRQELAHWIDLVFGYKQTGHDAIDAVNVFHPATYPSNQTQQLDEVEARARQTMIETYGQTPLQLFSSPHPLPMEELVHQDKSPAGQVSVLPTVTGLSFGHYVGSPGQPCPTVVWQQSQGSIVATLLRMETNEIIGLPARSLLLSRYNTGRTLGQIYSGLQLTGTHLITWGHSDNTLHGHMTGDNDTQLTSDTLAWDPIVSGATHPRVAAVWCGHQSGMVSVYNVQHCNKAPPKLSSPQYLHAHSDVVSSIQLCPEFGICVSSSNDKSVVTWDLHSFQLLHHISVESTSNNPVYTTIINKSGDIAVAVDSMLYLFTINLKPVASCDVGDAIITSVSSSNEEEGVSINCVAVGLFSGLVKLFSSLDLKHLRDVSGCPASPVTSLVYSEDSQNLAVATADGVVTILEKSGNKGLSRTPRYVTLQ